MPIGIEKIVVIREGVEQPWRSFYLTPDFSYELRVKYFSDTPEAMKHQAKWVLKPKDFGLYSSADQDGNTGDIRYVSMEAKFCGPKRFVIEAFLIEPTNSFPQQLEFWGRAPERIVSATWSKTNGGENIRNEKIQYGDNIHLNIQTEGLNGALLDIDIFNKRSENSEEKADTIHAIKCDKGEININIKNTYSWREFTGWTTSNSGEDFFIKVRVSGKSENIADTNGKETHAEFLTIEDEISTRNVETHEESRPLTVGENEVNVERYELCHFKSIEIIDDGTTISLFDEGLLLQDDKGTGEFHFSETIHFDFDEDRIRNDAKPVLDGVVNLLLDNPYIPSEIGAHCDIRGNNNYNDDLSRRRALSALNYLVDKGISRDKIIANGYGKRRLLITDAVNDDEHEQNRRLTVRFRISDDDAETIIFQTISPDINRGKEIEINIGGYQTDKCLRGSSDQHSTMVKIEEITNNGILRPADKSGTASIKHKVYSNLSSNNFIPFNYILPHKSSTNDFLFYINSCRYYYNNEKATVRIKVYPDIKWDFHFFLNLSNSPSVKWTNLGGAKHREMQEKAGKIGAEQRWKQVEVDFGVILEAQWNKIAEDNYETKEELTLTFDSKIRKIYSVFAQLKEISSIVTSKTKGKAIDTLGKRFPLGVEVLPPNFCLGAEWQLARGIKNHKELRELGTDIKFYFKAQPLIGLELTLDLLQLALGATGPAAPILIGIRDWLAPDGDDDNFYIDMYVNIKLFGTINIDDLSLAYNTASDETDPSRKAQLDASATIGVTLEAGIMVKATAAVIVGEFYVEAGASFEGTGSITFGHSLVYEQSALYYQPKLLFDGLIAKVEIKATVGLEIKRSWFSGDYNKELVDHNKEYNLIRPFDIIKSVEDLMEIETKIKLIG
ncbi:OmpA family protein [Olleya aquimaris]|uniref:OmpA family protein n=1 Tax=Olleya sediminilitoris TaxID=2795739 RepID=A0ABS1WKB9_9FLAO|nr:OmpA family protein [Olleya sediminilitoris]AXO79615.1 OmpA family protein [Olleya aquimaris]MBL7559571.1 OmpA family protein [Olleya sediminilitoris]